MFTHFHMKSQSSVVTKAVIKLLLYILSVVFMNECIPGRSHTTVTCAAHPLEC